MALLGVVSGLLLTIVGTGLVGFGGTLPTLFSGTYLMLLIGMVVMAAGIYVIKKSWGKSDAELVGIGPQGERYYK